MSWTRATKAPPVRGGVTRAPRACPRKAPNRPSDARTPSVPAPIRSKGRNSAGTAWSAMPCAAVRSQRPEGKVAGVVVVLEEEDAWEAGAVPERILPAPTRLLRADQVLDAALRGRPHGPGRQEPEHRPRRLTRCRGALPGPLGMIIALARLPPAPCPHSACAGARSPRAESIPAAHRHRWR